MIDFVVVDPGAAGLEFPGFALFNVDLCVGSKALFGCCVIGCIFGNCHIEYLPEILGSCGLCNSLHYFSKLLTVFQRFLYEKTNRAG